MTNAKRLVRIRWMLAIFIVGLVLSGVTAFPLTWEVSLMARRLGASESAGAGGYSGLTWWIVTVRDALRATDAAYPFIAYGTDWLAFAHLVIAVAFIGPWRDPVKNRWVIEWGMISCGLVIPLAMICGPLRGIPLAWRLVDCSFGVFGVIPLWLCWRWTRASERESSSAPGSPC